MYRQPRLPYNIYLPQTDSSQEIRIELVIQTVHILATTIMVSWGPDRIDLLLCGADSSLYHKFWDGKSWSPGPREFDKIGKEVWAEAPVTVSRQTKSIDTFTVGTDGKLYRIAFEDGSWKSPQVLGGQWGTQPVALVVSKDRVDVFHIGLAGGLYHKYFDGQLKPTGEQFNGLGGVCRGVPAVARVGTSNVHVCVLGSDSAIWTASWKDANSISGPAKWSSLVRRFCYMHRRSH